MEDLNRGVRCDKQRDLQAGCRSREKLRLLRGVANATSDGLERVERVKRKQWRNAVGAGGTVRASLVTEDGS